MVQKTVNISGHEVTFKASASVPRIYRVTFGRDIFKDLAKLQEAFNANVGQPVSLMQFEDLEMFENVAYIFAKHADPTIPDSIDEWLEQFDMLSIYEILPEIFDLWNGNMSTDVKAKKNTGQPSGK